MGVYLYYGEGDVATSKGAEAVKRLGLAAGGQQHRAVPRTHRCMA